MKRWAEEVLNPAIDPAALLRHLVKQAVYLTSGFGERSYRRPSRRDYGPVVMPCNQAPVPKIAIIVDTSGSMDDGQLGLALGLIGRVVESYRITDGIQIVTGDEEGKTVAFTTDPSEVDLRGGGGTDMGAIVESVVDGDDPPHIVLVATDGDTPWPDSDVGVPVVCCLTSRPCGYYSCPEWIEVVKMYES
jgi:predicted metal-dependent peptidase